MRRTRTGVDIRQILTKEILQEQLKKLSRQQIADKYEVSLSMIQKLIGEYGFSTVRKHRLEKEELETLVLKYSQKQIAIMYGLTQGAVCKLIKKYGITESARYKSIWQELKEYCKNVDHHMYSKMIELES